MKTVYPLQTKFAGGIKRGTFKVPHPAPLPKNVALELVDRILLCKSTCTRYELSSELEKGFMSYFGDTKSVCVDALCPSRQLFSHFRMNFCLPGLNQY